MAFVSLGTQILGLVGSQGILPASRFLETTAAHFDTSRFFLFPTLFWFDCHDLTLQITCWVGAALSCFLFFNLAPALICALLSLLYLSLVTVGQDFLSFQWDALLIETGLLAAFVAPWKWRPRFFAFPLYPGFALFLLRWLLFRFILLCGLVKLLSGDTTWIHLEALRFHFETQPLPSPLATSLDHLPVWLLRGSCAALLLVETAVPFFVFGSAPWKRTAFVLIAGLQVLILLSGNHAFFNWLTLVLCLPLLDDAIFASLSPDELGVKLSREIPITRSGWGKQITLYGLGSILWLASTLITLQSTLHQEIVPLWIQPLTTFTSQWRIANSYGVFAVMTTSRQEIIIEGSDDGQNWLPYELPNKPGNIMRRPTFVAPFQPRLDWQLWFAALSGYERTPWFQSLLMQLLQNSQSVNALFLKNPFPKVAPHYVRALLYDYQFADIPEHQATGAWWHRDFVGSYSPTLSLQTDLAPPAKPNF